jgi:hypothetical protein
MNKPSLLHLLTNRTSFCSPLFPMVTSYVPVQDTGIGDAARSLFGLDRTDTDFFVVAALGLLRTCPDLLGSLPDDSKLYDINLYRPGLPSVEGGGLIHDGPTAPGIVRVMTEWPPVFDIMLTLQTGGTGILQIGGQSWPVTTRTQDDLMKVSWPAASGITGLLRTDGDWSSPVWTLHHTPVRIPYALIRQQLLDSVDACGLLSQQQLMDAFAACVFDYRAVALALTALARHTLQIYNSTQS